MRTLAKTIAGLRRALIVALAFVLIAVPTISAHPVHCLEEPTAGFSQVDASKITASQHQHGHGNPEAGRPSGPCCAAACNACGMTIAAAPRSSSTTVEAVAYRRQEEQPGGLVARPPHGPPRYRSERSV